MGINKNKKKLLIEYVDYICENCHKKFKFEELEIHRIKSGSDGGTYCHRNCMVICNSCHKIFTSAQNIARGVQ